MTQLVGTAIAGLFALVAAYVAARSARRVAKDSRDEAAALRKEIEKAAEKKVDAEAFARAKEIYDGAIGQLQDQLRDTRSDAQAARRDNQQLREDLQRVQTELQVEKEHNEELRRQLGESHLLERRNPDSP